MTTRAGTPLRRWWAALAMTAACLSGAACSAADDVAADAAAPGVAPAGARVATDWARYAASIIRTKSVLPPHAARAFAYSSLAVARVLGSAAAPTAIDEAAAVWAGAALLVATVPDATTLVGAERDRHLATLGLTAAQATLARARAEVVATPLLAQAAGDGYATSRGAPFTPRADELGWVPTGVLTQPLEPGWGTHHPFAADGTGGAAAAEAVATCAAEVGPPALADLDAEARAVMDADDEAGADQIAYYWSDAPARTSTPAGHWLELAAQLADEQGLGPAAGARLLAEVAMAGSDAFIVAWRLKYDHRLLRPVTYIQRHLDPSWRPRLITPAFPEYVSGHAAVSGAAAAVLEAHFGPAFAFVDRSRAGQTVYDSGEDPHLLGAVAYPSLAAAADEAARSRLYGGIHFPMGNAGGLVAGRCAARLLLAARP